MSAYLRNVHAQYAEILGQLGYGVVETKRIPPRTRNNLAKRKDVFRVHFDGMFFYVAPTVVIDRLLRNEERRNARKQLQATYAGKVSSGEADPKKAPAQRTTSAEQKRKVKARRLLRHAGSGIAN